MNKQIFMMKPIKFTINRNRAVIIISFCVILVILGLLFEESYICTYSVSWIVNIFFLFRIKDCQQIEGNLFNRYTIFLCICYLYMFGRTLLFSLNLIDLDEVLEKYEILLINKYLLFATPAFYIFTMPVVLFKDKLKNVDTIIYQEDYITKKCVAIISAIFLVASAPFYWKNTIEFVVTALISGYAANYIDSGVPVETTGIIGNLLILYVPSIAFLMVNSKSKFLQYIFLSLLVVPAFSYMFVGARGNAMSLLTCSVFLWVTEVLRSPKKKVYIFIIAVVGFLLLWLFSILREVRNYSLGSPVEIINMLMFTNPFEGIISSIKEIGGTIYVWIEVKCLVPSVYSYGYGYSYLASFFACIPSVLIGYSFAEDAALDVWLTDTLGADYGLGFSIFAEAYYNFGALGIVFIFFVGWFVFYFLSGNVAKGVNLRYRNAISAIAIYFFTNIARNSMSLSIRNIFYGIVVPLILINILRNLWICKKRK